MNQNQENRDRVVSILSNKNLKEQIEILANVLIYLGVSHMETPKDISTETVTEIVLRDRHQNGETIANALALQGLTMMLWLEN